MLTRDHSLKKPFPSPRIQIGQEANGVRPEIEGEGGKEVILWQKEDGSDRAYPSLEEKQFMVDLTGCTEQSRRSTNV